MKNYYQILGVNKTSSQEDIKKAYRQLASKYHPDKYPDNSKFAQDMMKQINVAYDVLSDFEKKSAYDNWLGEDNTMSSRETNNKKTQEKKSSNSKKRNSKEKIPSFWLAGKDFWLITGAIIFIIIVFTNKDSPPTNIPDSSSNSHYLFLRQFHEDILDKDIQDDLNRNVIKNPHEDTSECHLTYSNYHWVVGTPSNFSHYHFFEVDPKIKVWIQDNSFSSLIEDSKFVDNSIINIKKMCGRR